MTKCSAVAELKTPSMIKKRRSKGFYYSRPNPNILKEEREREMDGVKAQQQQLWKAQGRRSEW